MSRPDVLPTLRSGHAVQRVAHYGFAQVFFRVPRRIRVSWNKNGSYFCPVCQHQVSQFLRIQRPYHRYCPICRSLQRHRLLWLFLQRHTPLFNDKPRRMLHLAPEPALAARLGALRGLQYVTADLNARATAVKLDVSALPFGAATFDLIMCSHVLEHVPDDRKAMRELRRIACGDGIAVLVVPIVGEVTDEDPAERDPLRRERRFGQFDHVRVYGLDFEARLSESGFAPQPFRASDVTSPAEAERFGLETADIIWLCRARFSHS